MAAPEQWRAAASAAQRRTGNDEVRVAPREDLPEPEHLKALNGAVVPLMTAKGLDRRVGVIGCASRTGGDGDNRALSERRAAEVDRYRRKLADPSVRFFKVGGSGEEGQASTAPQYRDAWPKLQSLDEDERGRSVVVLVQWQPVGAIDALNQPVIDWDRAFHQAAQRAALMYLLGGSSPSRPTTALARGERGPLPLKPRDGLAQRLDDHQPGRGRGGAGPAAANAPRDRAGRPHHETQHHPR
jgi:hypothetical protein